MVVGEAPAQPLQVGLHERTPYWLNGVVPLAFLLNLLIDAVLEAFYDLWMGQAAEEITSAEVALVLVSRAQQRGRSHPNA